MKKRKYKFVYGPVSSWRLGRSLGIDAVSQVRNKRCSFDCIYCQAGRTKKFTGKRKIFAPTDKILKEIKSLPPLRIDYITFSGRGEPTLAKNLGEIIKGIRKIKKKKIAVITNSSLIYRKDVQRDLALADFVMAKLDAHSQQLFAKINKPIKGIKFDRILKGIKKFKARYKGKFALQIMFIEKNKAYAREIADLAIKLKPDEIQINTPLRPCKVKPLTKKELDKIKKYFSAKGGSASGGRGTNYVSVYGV